MTTSTPTHPADSIADATNFVDAVERFIAACQYELSLHTDFGWKAHWLDQIDDGHCALDIVTNTEDPCAIEANLNAIDEEFGQAFATGDYSLLAF